MAQKNILKNLLYLKILILWILVPRLVYSQSRVVPLNLSKSQAVSVAKFYSLTFSPSFFTNTESTGKSLRIELSGVYKNLSSLNINPSNQNLSDNLALGYLTLKKGLYYNLDISFSYLIPYATSDEINGYGGLIEWKYDLKPKGVYLDFAAYGYTTNFENALISKNIGLSAGISQQINSLHLNAGANLEFSSTNFLLNKNLVPIVSGGRFNHNMIPFGLKTSASYRWNRLLLTWSQSFSFSGYWNNYLAFSADI